MFINQYSFTLTNRDHAAKGSLATYFLPLAPALSKTPNQHPIDMTRANSIKAPAKSTKKYPYPLHKATLTPYTKLFKQRRGYKIQSEKE